jgi:hypothetical protein
MGWRMKRVLRLSEGMEGDGHGIVGRLELGKKGILFDIFVLYLVL